MKKKETPATQLAREKQANLNRVFYTTLGEGGAPEIMDEMQLYYEPQSLIKKNVDGSVDVYATMAACGAYEVYSRFKQRIALGEKGV
jgi:hypothetical protein